MQSWKGLAKAFAMQIYFSSHSQNISIPVRACLQAAYTLHASNTLNDLATVSQRRSSHTEIDFGLCFSQLAGSVPGAAV